MMLMIRKSSLPVIFGACGFILVAVLVAASTSTDRRALLNTGLLALGVCVVALPIAMLTAITCLTRSNLARWLSVTCLGLLFVPLFVQVSAWDSAFGKLGWLISLPTFPGRFVAAWAPAIWIHALAAVPQVAVIFWFGLSHSGRTCEDHARLDVSPYHVFWHITLPRIMPLALTGMVWIAVICAREIAVTDIYRIGTVAEQIYLGYSLGEFDGSNNVLLPVLGWFPTMAIMVLISVVVLVAISSYSKNYLQSSDLKPVHIPASRFRDVVLVFIMMLILIVVPTISLFARAGKSVEMVNGTPTIDYSFQQLASVVTRVPVRYSAEFQWSAGIALISSVISMLLAIAIAWKACECRRWMVWLFALVAITAGIPGPLIGSTLLDGRNLIDSSITNWLFDRTIFAPVIANLVFCWPITCLLIWILLRSTARDALESARLEGATSWNRLTRVALAGNVVPMIGCWLLIFAICFGELSASQLAIPPGIDTVPRRMLGLLHAGVNNETAGLTIVVFLFIILVCLAGWGIIRWFRSGDRP